MNTGRERLLSDTRIALERKIQAAASVDSADRMFAAWLLGVDKYPFDDVRELGALISAQTGSYREVAALGYAAERMIPACPFRPELREALTWLSDRPMTIGSSKAGFVLDPVALLGIANGARCSGDPEVEKAVSVWMKRVLLARASLPNADLWEQCFIAAVSFRLRLPGAVEVPSSADVADCRLVLRARGVLPQTHVAASLADEGSLVHLLVEDGSDALGFSRAVIRAGAYDVLKNATVAAGVVREQKRGMNHTMTAAGVQPLKKVFVSYSWDSDEHQQRVRQLVDDLRNYGGFQATMDLYEPNPPEGLATWMLKSIHDADFVLAVITETYRKRCEGEEEEGKGKGVKWESGIMIRRIYQDEFVNGKFIPVVLNKTDSQSMPTVFISNVYFNVSDPKGFEALVRLMSDQPEYVPPPIGRTPVLPPRNSGGASSS